MKNFVSSVQSFFKMEQAGGIVIIFAAALALVVANSDLYDSYIALSHSAFSFNLLGISLDKDFHFFVNDGLMVIFFFLISLEVKREFISGELSNPKNVILPAVAALGGLLMPIAIYHAFNYGTVTQDGWAIAAATDIAIAFGVLALAGKRVPTSLKVFLMTLAIFDDVMVIGIIAFFFTESLNYSYLVGAAFCTLVLFALNKKSIDNFAPFVVVGFVLWYCVYMSGIHATIAGIILGLFIPSVPRKIYDNTGRPHERRSMLESLEHSLHETVSFAILPTFAFINAGVAISQGDISALTSNVSLGIIFGLFLGKQLGVFLTAYILIKTKIVDMPTGANWLQVYSIAVLCGVGFTMGLFIGGLSFSDPSIQYKLPILIGSTVSAIFGLALMKFSVRKM
ncbi:Na+/H+ antiporter NhaA [Vibrio splendidus]|nr:Na+/H+ antiporter NhaA [Vibrio splendidus]MCC4880434.1 Na+/H+ antiporter NhaA [Vibrio splendidus]